MSSPLRLSPEALDRLFPFALSCDAKLTITHVGAALQKVTGDVLGHKLLDVFSIERPSGIVDAQGVRAHGGEMFLFRARVADAIFRYQPALSDEGKTFVFVGSLVPEDEAQLDRLGVSLADFAAADPTPDALILRRTQERSLEDLDRLNHELQRSARALFERNQELAAAEARYRNLVEQLPLVTFQDRLDDLSSNIYTSPQISDMLGYTPEEWMSDPELLVKVLHPEDREWVMAKIAKMGTAGGSFAADYRLVHRDGHVVWVRDRAVTMSDADGKPLFAQGYLVDITTQKENEHQLHAYSSRLEALIAGMHSGVLVEDEHRRVVLTNQEFCRMFGIPGPPGSLVGSDCAAAAEQARALLRDRGRWTARIDEILAEGEPVLAEDLEFADGRVFERDYLPITVADESVGHLWIYRDVTDRRRMERDLERARDEAAAASDAKSGFLATMSHEIRTPMHGVLGTIDLLAGTDLDPEQRDLVEVVRTSAGALLELINDILDLQKVESGTVRLTQEPFDVGVIVKGVADLVRPSAEAQGLVLRVEIDPAIPSPLVGDSLRLRQVLLNLAGNAVKFTAEGHVRLRAALQSLDEGSAHLRLSVEDTGPGIPQEMQEAVFSPFVRLQGSDGSGTGLGLAISDRLVRLMGGTIALDSEPGRGTTVALDLRLRLGTADMQGAGPSPAGDDREPRAETTVLVVEDNPVNREVALRQLARLGVMARAVSDGRGAIEAIRHGHGYDLVLMDVRMPGIDGLEAASQIRAIETAGGRRRVPIVAMTANALPGDRRRCLDAGMDDYVTKPLLLDQVRELLQRWVPSDRDDPSSDGDDIEATLDRLAADLGDPTAAAHIADLWLGELEPRLDELRAAADRGEMDAAGAVAHTLKSSSAMIGAHSVSKAADALEAQALRDAIDPEALAKLERRAGEAAAVVRAASAALLTD